MESSKAAGVVFWHYYFLGQLGFPFFFLLFFMALMSCLGVVRISYYCSAMQVSDWKGSCLALSSADTLPAPEMRHATCNNIESSRQL